ncbi:MAG: class I SAM-dependent methyltransferase [Candidatus Micrarchaeia archaeon]|jgi:2-polyprenyl-3-methyl-5-hydroxy-6-metoxy-1,4-benzoquinol methylase
MPKDIYEDIPSDFYYKTKYSPNPVSSWYINNRYSVIRKWVSENYSNGKKIIDVGCASSLWNEGNVPVFGVDLNEKTLAFGKQTGCLTNFLVSDFEDADLAERSYDIVIISELLEHVSNPSKFLNKAKKIMKKSGLLIITVPFDTSLSLWKYLFAAQCFLMGRVFGKEYYKLNCGHINHFSPKSVKSLLNSTGFTVISEKNSLFMNIAILARKN